MEQPVNDADAGVVVTTPQIEAPPGRATSGVSMAQFVAERAAACLGADYSNFALLDRSDQRTIRLFHGASLASEVADRYDEFDVHAAYPIAAAIRLREVVVLSGADDYDTRFPDIWADTVLAGLAATVSLPLLRADGTVIGALGFGWTDAPLFDVRLDTALHALGQLCTEIVERAEVYDAEHRLVADLHMRLLGSMPDVSGVETAARYLPAGVSAAIGGDWYEGIVLDDERLAVVVGDVCGHGLLAAADMALVRGMITAVLIDGGEPSTVFGRVSNMLVRRNENVLGTAALAVVDVAHSQVTYATAGHPPPLLIDAAGTVTLLEDANGPLLGVSLTGHSSATVPFPPGARLVMYTDGLVERRDRPFDAGIAEMAEVLSAADLTGSSSDLIDLVLDALVGSRHADDIAVLVVMNVL